MDVSRETLLRLEEFSALVRKWNKAINLISKGTVDDIWDRHVVDSFQIYELGGDGPRWVDLGSGGGFPGLVVAILAHEKHPDRKVTLVEADQRKATFLREAARATGVQAEIVCQRIEMMPPLQADVLSARALAPLTDLLDFTERHRRDGGRSLFPKGEQHRQEIAEAEKTWHFEPVIHPSSTNASSVIVEVRSLSRV